MTPAGDVDPTTSTMTSTTIGEPVFVLRARDRLAPDVIDAWADRLDYINGGPTEKSAGARARAHMMRAWQSVNGARTPD
jgi:hypothetical protein